MTDLENMLFLKLRPASDHRLADLTEPILAEGDAAERKDIIFLEPLPLFFDKK